MASGPGHRRGTALATSLIDAASGPINWDRFRDTTAEELTALIEAKLANQPLQAPLDKPKAVLQLLDALKQSVAAVQNKPACCPRDTKIPTKGDPPDDSTH